MPALPWTKGQDFIPGCKITAIDQSTEFLRVTCQQQGSLNHLEITFRHGECEYWCTKYYRIQPIKGQATPPVDFLKKTMKMLTGMEKVPKYNPFVKKTDPTKSIRSVRGIGYHRFPMQAIIYTVLNLLLLLLWLYLIYFWIRQKPKQRVIEILIIGSALSLTVLLPLKIPDNLITVLHEELTKQYIRYLFGEGGHGGPNFYWFMHIINGKGIILDKIVSLNIKIFLLNIILLGVAAWEITYNIFFVILLMVMFGTDFIVINSAFSKLEGQLIFAIFLFSLPAAFLVTNDKTSHVNRFLAILSIILATFLVFQTRPEMSGIGIIALLTLIFLPWIRGMHPINALWQYLSTRRGRMIFATVTIGLLVLGYIIRLPFFGLLQYGIPNYVDWFFHGINVFSMAWLTYPILLAYLGRWCLVLLMAMGFIYTLIRPDKYLFLPLAFLLICEIQSIGGPGNGGPIYNMIRLSALTVPVAYFLAIYGWRYVEYLAQKHSWHRGWQPILLLTMLASFLTPKVSGLNKLLYSHPAHIKISGPKGALFTNLLPDWSDSMTNLLSSGLLSTNLQMEGRFLMDTVDAFPRCTIVSQVLKIGIPTPDVPQEYELVIFGAGMEYDKSIPYHGKNDIQQLLNGELAGKCVLFYRGIDCNIINKDQCRVGNAPLVAGISFRNRPYNSGPVFGEHNPTIRLELYKLH